MNEKESLLIQPRIRAEIGYIDLQGNLMAESRTELERLLRDWNKGPLRFVVVNCRDLQYIDSAGLSTLIGAQHRLKRIGGDLVLAEVNPSMEALFEVSSMQRYFLIFPSTADAARELRKKKSEQLKKGAATPKPPPAGKPKPRARVGGNRSKSKS